MGQVSVFIDEDIDGLADFIIKFAYLRVEEFSPGESGRAVFIVMLDLFLGDFRWQEVKVLKKKDASFTDGLGFDLFGKAWQVLVREELD